MIHDSTTSYSIYVFNGSQLNKLSKIFYSYRGTSKGNNTVYSNK